MERKVVVAGMGIWSCLGTSIPEVLRNLIKNNCRVIKATDRDYFISPMTTSILTPVIQDNKVGKASNYAIYSTKEALKNIPDDVRIGILYGNDSSIEDTVNYYKNLEERKSTRKLDSGTLFRSLNSNTSMILSKYFKLSGISMTISAACTSSAHAIGLSYILIKHGYEDAIVAGGAQETSAISVAAFDGLRTFSKTYPKPFDKDRDGLVPGGGAATLLITSEEFALKHNLTIYCELVGYGFNTSEDIANPDFKVEAECMLNALSDAKISPNSIGYINAHATGTKIGDFEEAKAIYEVFGSTPLVTSTKALTGHEMWMAGASELIYSIIMLVLGYIPPQHNFIEGDEVTSKLNIPTRFNAAKHDYMMSNSFGFGGTNCSIIIKRYERQS